MSAINATAKALFNTFFQTWSLPSSSSVSFILYSNFCAIFLLLSFHLLYSFLEITVSLCLPHLRTLKKKLINFDFATVFSGSSNAFKFIGLITKFDREMSGGIDIKDKQVCTFDLDPDEVPSLCVSEDEEKEDQQEQLEKAGKITKEYCSSGQRLSFQSHDKSFEILIQKPSKSQENNGSFHDILAFWRRKEMEEMIHGRKLKYEANCEYYKA